MKNNLTYFKNWMITLTISTLVWAFVSGFVTNFSKLLFSSVTASYYFVWIIGTVVICAALAITSWRTGIEINSKSKPVSLAMPVFSQIAGALIYIIIFAVTKGKYIVSPSTLFLAKALLHDSDPNFTITAPLSELIGLCVLQAFIYSAVSITVYILAKYKQDHKNPVVRKLREEANM